MKQLLLYIKFALQFAFDNKTLKHIKHYKRWYSDMHSGKTTLSLGLPWMTYDAIDFLKENGLPIAKAQVYKLSFQNEIPASRIGKRLVFSRKDLLNWLAMRTIEKVSPQRKAAEKLSKSANRRERASL